MTLDYSLDICAEEAGNEDLGRRVRAGSGVPFRAGTCLALLVEDEETLKKESLESWLGSSASDARRS